MENTVFNVNVFIISVLIGVLALISAISFNSYSELKSMERNIESAIVKGIDPIAVRCAYKPDYTNCAIYITKSK
jgi:hypothetical protein